MFSFGSSDEDDKDEPRDVGALTRQYAAERMAQGENFGGRRVAHANAMGAMLTAAQRATIAAKAEEMEAADWRLQEQQRAAAAVATQGASAVAARAGIAGGGTAEQDEELVQMAAALSVAATADECSGGNSRAGSGAERFKRLAMGVKAGARLAMGGGALGVVPLLPTGVSSAVLDVQMRRALARRLPTRLVNRPWRLQFSLREHGASLASLLARGGGGSDHVFALRARGGVSLGGYVAGAAIEPHSGFVGGTESFVFSFPAGERFDVFPGHGGAQNEMVLLADRHNLGMGGGGGGFAWCVDDELRAISSSCCETFGNVAPLLGNGDDGAATCVCEDLEVWEVT